MQINADTENRDPYIHWSQNIVLKTERRAILKFWHMHVIYTAEIYWNLEFIKNIGVNILE